MESSGKDERKGGGGAGDGGKKRSEAPGRSPVSEQSAPQKKRVRFDAKSPWPKSRISEMYDDIPRGEKQRHQRYLDELKRIREMGTDKDQLEAVKQQLENKLQYFYPRLDATQSNTGKAQHSMNRDQQLVKSINRRLYIGFVFTGRESPAVINQVFDSISESDEAQATQFRNEIKRILAMGKDKKQLLDSKTQFESKLQNFYPRLDEKQSNSKKVKTQLRRDRSVLQSINKEIYRMLSYAEKTALTDEQLAMYGQKPHRDIDAEIAKLVADAKGKTEAELLAMYQNRTATDEQFAEDYTTLDSFLGAADRDDILTLRSDRAKAVVEEKERRRVASLTDEEKEDELVEKFPGGLEHKFEKTLTAQDKTNLVRYAERHLAENTRTDITAPPGGADMLRNAMEELSAKFRARLDRYRKGNFKSDFEIQSAKNLEQEERWYAGESSPVRVGAGGSGSGAKALEKPLRMDVQEPADNEEDVEELLEDEDEVEVLPQPEAKQLDLIDLTGLDTERPYVPQRLNLAERTELEAEMAQQMEEKYPALVEREKKNMGEQYEPEEKDPETYAVKAERMRECAERLLFDNELPLHLGTQVLGQGQHGTTLTACSNTPVQIAISATSFPSLTEVINSRYNCPEAIKLVRVGTRLDEMTLSNFNYEKNRVKEMSELGVGPQFMSYAYFRPDRVAAIRQQRMTITINDLANSHKSVFRALLETKIRPGLRLNAIKIAQEGMYLKDIHDDNMMVDFTPAGDFLLACFIDFAQMETVEFMKMTATQAQASMFKQVDQALNTLKDVVKGRYLQPPKLKTPSKGERKGESKVGAGSGSAAAAAALPRKAVVLEKGRVRFGYTIARFLMSPTEIDEMVLNPKQDIVSSSAPPAGVRRSARPRSDIQVWRGIKTIHEFIRADQATPRSEGRFDYEFPMAHPIADLVRRNLHGIFPLLKFRLDPQSTDTADVFLEKWLDSVHFMAVLPSAIDQIWHSDHDTDNYFTVIIALTGYDPETGGTEFSGVDEKDTNVPKLDVGDGLIFDGLREHRGMANKSKTKERYFLYAVLTQESDRNLA